MKQVRGGAGGPLTGLRQPVSAGATGSYRSSRLAFNLDARRGMWLATTYPLAIRFETQLVGLGYGSTGPSAPRMVPWNPEAPIHGVPRQPVPKPSPAAELHNASHLTISPGCVVAGGHSHSNSTKAAVTFRPL